MLATGAWARPRARNRRKPRRSNCEFSRSTISTATCGRRPAASGSPIPTTRPRRSRSRPAAPSTWRRWSSSCAQAHNNTIFVAAGDLIGASPFLSAMFHDEPTIESLSMMGLEIASRRQSRIRRGQGRTAADAERRLSSGRQMPGAASVPRREIPLSRRQHHREDHRQDHASRLRDQGIRGHSRRLHRPDLEGHARTSSRPPASPAWNSATRPRP